MVLIRSFLCSQLLPLKADTRAPFGLPCLPSLRWLGISCLYWKKYCLNSYKWLYIHLSMVFGQKRRKCFDLSDWTKHLNPADERNSMWIMWISSCITRLFRSFLLAEVWINGVENNFRWPGGRASGGLILCSFKVEGHFLKTNGNVARHNLQ